MFIVELTTREGRVCESYETYAEARRRVEQFPQDALVGLPFIFEQLADGSERLVREDGKPLQFHRTIIEESRECSDDPLPVAENVPPDAKIRFDDPPADDWQDLPMI